MHRLFITFIGLFSFILVQAQLTDAGNFMVGTSFGLSTATSTFIQDQSEGEGPSSTLFSISPKVGYFVIDNLGLGVGMDYTFSEVREPNEDRTKDSDLLFGPFARFYLPISDDIAFFLEGNFGFGNSSDNLNIAGEVRNINTNIFAVGFGPGLTVFSNESLGISAIFKYNYARSDFDIEIGGVKQETITKTNQFDISVGVSFYFSAITPAGRSTRTSPGY